MMNGPMIDQKTVLDMQAKLFKKLMSVVEKMENTKKSGYNSHQKYHYSTEQDLIDSVRQLLIDNKILILTDSETKEVVKINKIDSKGGTKESLVTVVNTRHTFCDIETGYTYNIQGTGTGWDDTDKGAFKAITGAMKYFLAKNFLVPGEDDAENDGVTPKKEIVAAPVSKGFTRTAAKPAETTVQVTSSSANGVVKTETKVVDIPKVANDTSQVTEKFSQPTTTVAKPSFGRKLTATKTEPNFP
jgi:hypothetical protein